MRSFLLPAIVCGLLSLRLSATESLRPNPPDLTPGIAAAQKQFERGDYAGAEATYLELLKADESNVYLLSDLGVVFLREKKYELAEAAFKRALVVHPDDEYSQCMLGSTFQDEGKNEEAVVALTKAIALDPKDATAHNYLGIALSKKEQEAAAAKELETAIALSPKYGDAHFNLAWVLATQSIPELERAGEHYERALQLDGERDQELEALIHWRRNESFDAVIRWGRGNASSPSPPRGDGGWATVPEVLRPLVRTANEQAAREDYRAAENTYRQLLGKAPDNVYALANLGVILFRAVQGDRGLVVLQKAVAIAPEDAFSHRTLGIVYYAQQKLDAALDEFIKALVIDPKDAVAHSYLGVTAAAKGWLGVAGKEFETARQLDPDLAQESPPGLSGIPNSPSVPASAPSHDIPAELLPLVHEAKKQFERGDYPAAEASFRKVLESVPDNLYTLSNLGVVLHRQHKFKLAEEMFRKALQVAPEDAFSHCTLGIVYYDQGSYDEAVGELQKALAIDPKNATAHNYLGITDSQKGRQQDAVKELQRAIDLDPKYADAHFNLAVVFATETPPDQESARKYYARALELGADRDASLESLIKAVAE